MKIWRTEQFNRENILSISQNNNISALSAMLIDEMKFENDDEIAEFISQSYSFEDPFLIKDMEKAVDRVKTAVEDYEKICVYGDYDADGVTSTALLYSYLKSKNANVCFYVPSRENEGYGLNNNAIDYLKTENVELIVTVDNGVSAYEQVEHAKEAGIDIVITDHHEPPERLPKAIAVVDPHRKDDNSTYKDFSGVGLAFKFAMAYEGENADIEALLDEYSDIVALGTVGDLVNLTGENRMLVKEGLKRINNCKRLGLNALKEVAGIEKPEIKSGDLAFSLCPRINAGGRLGLSVKSVRLLITENPSEALAISKELNDDNTERQEIEKSIVAEAERILYEDDNIKYKKIIVIAGKKWHQGVIGIVAARIKERCGKPTIIISYDGPFAKGSARSVEGFRMCDGVAYCKELLTIFGGHPMAAGFSLPTENIDAFRDMINEYADNVKQPFFPVISLACSLMPSKVTVGMIEDLSALEPFGSGNPTPVFGIYDSRIIRITALSGGKHTKITFIRQQNYFEALYFGINPEQLPYTVGDTVNVAVTAGINEFNGKISVSYYIKDICFSSFDSEAMLKSNALFEDLMDGKPVTEEMRSELSATRENCAEVYRFLKKNNGFPFSAEALYYKINAPAINFGKMCLILKVLEELSLITLSSNSSRLDIKLVENPKRVDLFSARVFKLLQ
ncbi:MAG: single-stranded-DNA-specific exonuclease RecJ [Acutalibacteraceae bacterium]|nr:single-stranded-DNA-specific exonuclease RecJ [Acutalibacteraceae bacterium]